MPSFTVTRQIAIDAGHRIMTHGSKCRHLHGHRYVIEATCRSVAGTLQETGEQTDMVLDFGFLKEAMLAEIDVPCDHGLIVSVADRGLLAMLAPIAADADAWAAALAGEVARAGWVATQDCRLGTKLYAIAPQPTAEALARHWFQRLAPQVAQRSAGLARLEAVTVHETPNCTAEYREPAPP